MHKSYRCLLSGAVNAAAALLRPTSRVTFPTSSRSRSLATAVATPHTDPLTIGQPTPHTHPHLLKTGEVTPGITLDEFKARRQRLVSKIAEKGTVIVAGYGLRYATNGIFHQFHQHTDLLYLAGIDEPDCAMVLERNSQSPNGYKMILFVRPRDRSREIWDGPRAGFEGAMQFFGADEARSINTLAAYIESLRTSAPGPIYTDLPLTPVASHPLDETHIQHSSSASAPDSSITSSLRKVFLGSPKTTVPVHGLAPITSNLRLHKSPAEIALMRTAGRMTGRAFVEMMRETKPGGLEHDIWAVGDYRVRRAGASRLAYVPVVASGSNALTIHYVVNNQVMRDGTMVLVDAGAEYAGYAADVTRTWPVNGRFTKEQAALYQVVLDVQRQCIAKCTGDAQVSLDDLQREAFDGMRAGCSKVFGRAVSKKEMNVLYPHHVGHWLGLDVHDTHAVRRTTRLQSGMVVTLEPGLYVPDTPDYPEGFRGVGIRIEDDIAIGSQETGWAPVVLSVEAPKEVVDVEAVMAGVV
ncbi:hypothetical protein HKX48_003585 [Thoreauomyces humboldtii]|nr:hypothetical protein HKX48_003585 [Thoreauomyces humboldtii]